MASVYELNLKMLTIFSKDKICVRSNKSHQPKSRPSRQALLRLAFGRVDEKANTKFEALLSPYSNYLSRTALKKAIAQKRQQSAFFNRCKDEKGKR